MNNKIKAEWQFNLSSSISVWIDKASLALVRWSTYSDIFLSARNNIFSIFLSFSEASEVVWDWVNKAKLSCEISYHNLIFIK